MPSINSPTIGSALGSGYSSSVGSIVTTVIASINSSAPPMIVSLTTSVSSIGNQLFAPDEPVSAPSFIAPPNVGAVHDLVAGAVSVNAAGVNSASVSSATAALTFGLPVGGQAASAQASQVVVSPQNAMVESAKAIAPGASALGAMPGDAVYRGPAAEPSNALGMLPLQELPRVDRDYVAAPSGNYEMSRLAGETHASGSFEVTPAATPLAIRGALIAGMAPNFEALDRALEVTLDEIEKMGGDLITWLDESDNMSWAIGGAVVVLAAGGYYWQRRRAGQAAEGNSEELSSWLFTHVYHPTGRP